MEGFSFVESWATHLERSASDPRNFAAGGAILAKFDPDIFLLRLLCLDLSGFLKKTPKELGLQEIEKCHEGEYVMTFWTQNLWTFEGNRLILKSAPAPAVKSSDDSWWEDDASGGLFLHLILSSA